ncbi:jg7653 [Pararge aegeria aegeria]|uniref:Jg7653 protein n=1 Tax=Pararge aegeria aegeria TaxID=348720 RepID=A0A8S4SPI5_9NEOP|nr:jg7653 [Pararge aegeria aegeria]
MSLDDGNTDEYVVTALQIFQYCGVEAGSTLRVDALMDQFAPFVKTNKAEYSYLRSLLDPEQSNPEITVSMLANSLNKYSESQKVKVDLEESFNLKNGQLPHDSDSGISTDGFQLLEELQCELREKSRLAQQLRTQLDYTDRHHEEALATVTAERDSLRAHLNMLRDENMTLTHVRRDYEDVCERLGCSEKALDESRRELECTRRRTKVLTEQVALLENEKLNLQELLSKSKDECHRINDMYASRQSSLLEKNETLRAEHADLSSRMRYQEEYMQQLIKEKVVLEMEVKDMLNKSNLPVHHMERSIDVSYTEDQMLTALDSLNADSRFPQDGRLLDEESFVNALKEDQGIPTNMSLFDEIRLSFCNMSRHNTTDLNFTQPIEKPVLDDFITSSTQTDDKLYYLNENEIFKNCRCKIISDDALNVSTQTDENITGNEETKDEATNTSFHVFEVFKDIEVMNYGTQTEENKFEHTANNNDVQVCFDCTKCFECERTKKYVTKLEKDIRCSNLTITEMEVKLDQYDKNLNNLKRYVDEGDEKNNFLKAAADSLKAKLVLLEVYLQGAAKESIPVIRSALLYARAMAAVRSDASLARVPRPSALELATAHRPPRPVPHHRVCL